MLIAVSSVLVFSYGTFSSSSQIVRSGYVCFQPLDSATWTISLQVLGLCLDAVIAVLLWRVLAWTRTVKLRTRTLGSIMVSSAISMALVWMTSAFLTGGSHNRLSFSSLYGFDILVDSCAYAALAICGSLWLCETSPLLVCSIITVSAGMWTSMTNVGIVGNWLHPNKAPAVFPAWIIAMGAIVFFYYNDVKRVFFVSRILFASMLVILSIFLTFKAISQDSPTYPRHPLSDLIFKANTEHERWVTKATTSRSLAVAVANYKDLHPNQQPPPNFDKWYEFAQGSLVIDSFDQIDEDLAPFWSLKPEELRHRADTMASQPGVAAIVVTKGVVTHTDAGEGEGQVNVKELIDMIGQFSTHLPDMVLPINLGSSPQILPPWEDVHRRGRSGLSLTLRRDEPADRVQLTGPLSSSDTLELMRGSCPPTSRIRGEPERNVAEFCLGCIKRHSKHGFLTKWARSLQTCEQPDLSNLHEVFMGTSGFAPIRKLMPLFSWAKTDAFSDILIPLPQHTLGGNDDIKWDFRRRYDSLFWRGKIGQHGPDAHAWRGSQKYRLLNLFADPDPSDEVTLLVQNGAKDHKFGYERVLASEVNNIAPFDFGLNDFADCHGEHCELLKQKFAAKEETQEPLEYRYVLLTDEDKGPPSQLMRTLRSSGSIPFLSTVFRSWYTERLQPYLHFVPIDPRFHALHSTYLYFTGTTDRAQVNGKDAKLKGASNDAEWIAREGHKWTEKAVGKKDMEVYLFRLLLEWGRLLDEKRDAVGFWQKGTGDFENLGWTESQSI